MRKEDLLKLCGSMEQVAGVREIEYLDGRAAGLRCAQVTSGALSYALMLDKCLDPAYIHYKGINLSLMTKPGLQGRNPYDTAGEEAARSIMGGAMFTCGMDHVHGHTSIDGVEYPTHGRMRTTPAEKVGMDAFFGEGGYHIRVSGEMRQARIFGENIVLRRRADTVYGEPEIQFTDEIENQAFAPEPLCFLYHCNFGYPLLAPGSRLILPSVCCMPRDDDAAAGMDGRYVMGMPEAGAKEQVFQHVLAADREGNTFAALANARLELALCIRFNIRQMPYMTQWKSCAAGDYAMAVEPTNVGFAGRGGKVQVLPPLAVHRNDIRFCIIEGKEGLEGLERECRELLQTQD